MLRHRYIPLLTVIIAYCSCKQPQPSFFKLLPAAETGISFTNQVHQTDSFNVLTYPYIYNGAGVAVADINKDGLEDLFFTANEKGKNKLYLNKGSLSAGQAGFQFEDVTVKAGVQGKADWCNGITVTDINGDEWPDFYISTVTLPGYLQSQNELYINNKDGTFTEAAATYGLNLQCHTTQSVFFDADNDGDLDCFLLNHAATYLEAFQDASARTVVDSASGNKLLRNDNGYFHDVTEKAGIYSSSLGFGLGVAVGDLNNDGWQDIYVSNDFKENDYCYINNGNGTFTERTASLFSYTSRFSMGNDMADYNNDGWPDMITVDMLPADETILKSTGTDDDMQTYDYKRRFGFYYQLSKNCLQQNVDGVSFNELGLQAGVAATDWSWAPLFADFNNDGKKDLFISNGYRYRLNDQDFSIFLQEQLSEQQKKKIKTPKLPLTQYIPEAKVPDQLFFNRDGVSFEDVSAVAGFTTPDFSNGAVYVDLDNDGDLDLVINRMDTTAAIYKNEMPVKNYINIQLKGSSNNTLGIGTKLFVYSGGVMQLYHQSLSRGFMSSVSPLIHVGLHEQTKVDSLIVIWPDGNGQQLKNIAANKLLTLSYKDAISHFPLPVLTKQLSHEWTDVTETSGITFTHKEDLFNDFNTQPFLPHSLATQGPKTTVADVNGDGLEDVFFCGAKNQPAQLFVQTIQSTFVHSPQSAFNNDSAYEDTDAVFFDADNDGDTDLYVTSGGNEYYGRQELLKDRLYLNDGKGNFSKSNLPDLFENKSCVRACDFDKDGDVDLFVGGRANARMYGYTPASVLLTNNGKGVFTETTETNATGLLNTGMVTDACWSDIDKDGWMDLIVVGEWMPVTIFKNAKGKLIKTNPDELKNSTGWWNCIYATDLDNDGDDDFLLGNWGTNSKLTASVEHPLQLFIADWDNNSEIDPILSLYKNENYYTFLTKPDLERRLPYLKKQFFKFSDMAGKTTEQIFQKEPLQKARVLQACTFQSSMLINNNGSFKLSPLPVSLQTAPLFSFASYKNNNGKQQYMTAGNFYEVTPYEGRYDALLPVVFEVNNETVAIKEHLLQRGPVRKIQPLQLKNGEKVWMLVRNNAAATVMKPATIRN
jgi:enediyne biosynthesis protein E4